MAFIDTLTKLFTENAAAGNAEAMSAYLKNLFPFYGIKTPLRRELLKNAVETHKEEVIKDCRTIALKLYTFPEREYHHCAIDLLIKQLKKSFTKADIVLIEKLLVTHSWWDSVDTISKYLLGYYLKQFPEETNTVIERFSRSENMWLNRAAILFQLDYKKNTDEAMLFAQCTKHRESKEFFIQKAIGWALREYAKTNPDAVRAFAATAGLKPLSSREALKNL